jgi:hypothetical protein
MRYLLMLTLGLLLPATMTGQSRVTTLVGVGNSFGGLGVMADVKPLGNSPVSLMLSVGSTKTFFDTGDPEPNPWTDISVASVAGAVGLRGTVGRGRHQGFLELAYLPVDDDVVRVSGERQRIQMLYGLGLQFGYRALVSDNVTVNALGGAGYALNSDVVASPWKPVFGFGVGYAWGR